MSTAFTRFRSLLSNRDADPPLIEGEAVPPWERTTTPPTESQSESGFVSGRQISTISGGVVFPANKASPVAAGAATPSAGTSWYVSVFLVVNAALGSALLNFPCAFNEAGGVVAALGVQTALLVVAVATLAILAVCADANNAATYQDVVSASLGKVGHVICALVVVLYCFGTCVTFLIIIGDQWDRYFYSFNNYFCHTWWKRRTFTITVSSVIFILPLCFSKRIDFLKYVSAFGVLAVVYINFLQIYKFYEGVDPKYVGEVKTKPDHWTDLFLVAPTIFFGYQCHVSAVPIYSCLRNRSVAEFLKTVLTAMLVCMATYSVAAVYGYLTFGSKVYDDILTNYDASDPLVSVALIAMALKTYTTYPLLIFCGRTGVESLWIKARRLTPGRAAKGELVRRIVTVVTWFVGTVVVAVYLPGIDSVIPVLGAFATTFIVIFPGLCLLQIVLKRADAAALGVDVGAVDRLKMRNVSRATPPTFDGAASFGASSFGASINWAPETVVARRKRTALKCLAIFLIVFGFFILGIIVTNGFMQHSVKTPLCSY